jgi:hypothetical protein
MPSELGVMDGRKGERKISNEFMKLKKTLQRCAISLTDYAHHPPALISSVSIAAFWLWMIVGIRDCGASFCMEDLVRGCSRL